MCFSLIPNPLLTWQLTHPATRSFSFTVAAQVEYCCPSQPTALGQRKPHPAARYCKSGNPHFDCYRGNMTRSMLAQISRCRRNAYLNLIASEGQCQWSHSLPPLHLLHKRIFPTSAAASCRLHPRWSAKVFSPRAGC